MPIPIRIRFFLFNIFYNLELRAKYTNIKSLVKRKWAFLRKKIKIFGKGIPSLERE